MISRALLNAPFFIPKDADLLRNRKVNTKKRQNRHLPELAFLILGTYFTAPSSFWIRYTILIGSVKLIFLFLSGFQFCNCFSDSLSCFLKVFITACIRNSQISFPFRSKCRSRNQCYFGMFK